MRQLPWAAASEDLPMQRAVGTRKRSRFNAAMEVSAPFRGFLSSKSRGAPWAMVAAEHAVALFSLVSTYGWSINHFQD